MTALDWGETFAAEGVSDCYRQKAVCCARTVWLSAPAPQLAVARDASTAPGCVGQAPERIDRGGRGVGAGGPTQSVRCHLWHSRQYEEKCREHVVDDKTKGAWLLAQSKSLDAVSGVGRLENIQYAGRTGRLYNLLRRSSADGRTPVVSSMTVTDICRLNNIDRASRQLGLQTLQAEGRIDVSASGDIAVLGATTEGALEATPRIFEARNP